VLSPEDETRLLSARFGVCVQLERKKS